MIAAIASLIFYIIDPMLGIIVALLAPSIIGLDMDGTYGELLVFLLFAVGAFMVRRLSTDKED